MARKFICILPIHFKAVVSSGRESLQLYSPGLQFVKEGQDKPCTLPESLEGCRKALAKTFAWLPWPFAQRLISQGPLVSALGVMPTAECWLCSEMASALPTISEFVQFPFSPSTLKHSTSVQTANEPEHINVTGRECYYTK